MRSKKAIDTDPIKSSARRSAATAKTMRVTALALAAVLFFAAALTGCSKEEVSLLSAIVSAPQMTSYEYEGNAQLDLRFDIFEQEGDEYYYFRQPTSYYKMIEKALDGAGVNVSAKYSGNKENTKGATEMLMTPYYFGGKLENLTVGVWADVDLDDPDYLKEYIKLPEIITAGAAWDYMKGRDYLTLSSKDFDMLFEESGMDIREFMTPERIEAQVAAAEKLSDIFAENLIHIAELLDTDSSYILSVDKDSAGNSVYHLKITDEGLKSFIAAFAKIDKDEMKKIVRLLLDASLEYLKEYEYDLQGLIDSRGVQPGSVSMAAAIILSQYDDLFDMVYPEFVQSINSILEKKQLFKLLGNNGITLDITVSRDGFITGADGIIDLVIDLRGFALAGGERFTGTVSKTHVKLTFQNQFTNVNKDVVVKMPNITNLNSISFSRLIEMINAQSGGSYDTDTGFVIESNAGGIPFGSAAGQPNPDIGALQDWPDLLGELKEDIAKADEANDTADSNKTADVGDSEEIQEPKVVVEVEAGGAKGLNENGDADAASNSEYDVIERVE